MQFPLDLGIANELQIRASFGLEDNHGSAFYFLRNVTAGQPPKVLSNGNIRIPTEIFEVWGVDNQPIIDFVAAYLKVEILPAEEVIAEEIGLEVPTETK